MKIPWGHWLLCATLLFLAGCLEVHQQITVNPDRSAKIRVRLTFDLALLKDAQSSEGIDMRQELLEAEDSMRSLAYQCITTAKGVEAWTDYSLVRENNDRLTATMTAYTRDVTTFELNPENGEIPNMTFTESEEPDGRRLWSMHMAGVNNQPEELPKAVLSKDEISGVVAERRLQFDEESRESKVLFEGLKITAALRFPGKVLQTNNALKTSRQEAAVVFEGKRFYAMMERVLSDASLAEQAFGAGAELHSGMALPGSQVNAWLFGKRGPVTVTVAPGERALFDYSRELVRAKKNPPLEVLDLFE